jgi:hypothetical protein
MTVTINGATGIAGVNGTAVIPAMQGSDTNTGVFYGTDIVAVSTGGTERMRINASGQAEFTAGTAALPAIATTGDTNTGVFYPAADTVAVSTGGTERMRVNASGNVGIGTASPSGPLNVVAASASALAIAINGRSSDNAGAMYIYQNDGTTQLATIIGSPTEFRLSSVPAAAVQTFYTNSAERMRIAANGDLSFNSGYGSAAVAYGCRAWVNFNGTGTVAIRGSGNVTSITDNGTGSYTVNFTTAMPDVNYNVVTGGLYSAGTYVRFVLRDAGTAPATSSVRLLCNQSGSTQADIDYVDVSIFR